MLAAGKARKRSRWKANDLTPLGHQPFMAHHKMARPIRPSLEDFSYLVDQIYTAGAESSAWQSVLAELIRFTASSSGCLPINGRSQNRPEIEVNVPDELRQEYQSSLVNIDRLSHWARRVPSFEGTTSELFTRNPGLKVAEFEERVAYYGMSERWGANLSKDVAISLHRDATLPVFSDAEKRFLSRLVPHLRNAIGIQKRLAYSRKQRDGLAECIGDLGIGLVLMDAKGRRCFVNPRAEMIFRDTALLDIFENHLRARSAYQDQILQAALGSVIQGKLSRASLWLTSEDHRLELSIAPFRWPSDEKPAAQSRSAMYVVFVSEPDCGLNINVETLRELYDLTKAEADTLRLLVNEYGADDIASVRAVSINTVRSQLQSLREKTGARNLVELTRIAICGTARLLDHK